MAYPRSLPVSRLLSWTCHSRPASGPAASDPSRSSWTAQRTRCPKDLLRSDLGSMVVVPSASGPTRQTAPQVHVHVMMPPHTRSRQTTPSGPARRTMTRIRQSLPSLSFPHPLAAVQPPIPERPPAARLRHRLQVLASSAPSARLVCLCLPPKMSYFMRF